MGLLIVIFAQEVNASLSESAHLFILRRYALENYLLEPFAVWEELRIYPSKSFKVADSSAMEKELLKLCEQLKTLIAANSVIYEASTGAKYFKEGYIMSDRANKCIHFPCSNTTDFCRLVRPSLCFCGDCSKPSPYKRFV